MAISGHDRKITVWNCLSNRLERTLTDCHKDWVTSCCFSDISSNILLTGSSDFTLKTWDLSSGAEKITFKGHTSAINDVAMSQGCVVSAAFDGSVKVWTHKAVEITTLFCHKQRVNACHIHVPDKAQAKVAGSAWADLDEDGGSDSKIKLGEILVMTGSDDGTVRVWKAFLPNEVASLTGHSDRVLSVATTLNNQILSSSLDCSLRTWKIPAPASELTAISSSRGHDGPVTSLSGLAANENESFILSGGRDGYVGVWTLHQHNFKNLYKIKKESGKAVTSVCMVKATSNQGGEFAVGSGNGSFTTYQYNQQQTNTNTSVSAGSLMGAYPLTKLVLGPDKTTVFGSSWSSKLAAVGLSGRVAARNESHKDWVTDCIISGDKLYSVSLDGKLASWDISGTSFKDGPKRTYNLRLTPADEKSSVWPLSLCAIQGTRFLAIADSTGRVSLWNKQTFTMELMQKVHAKQVNVVASLGENTFLSGSDDGVVKAWRVGRRAKLTQIGQFYGQSCITALTAVEGRQAKNSPSVFAVGDSLGHMTVLQWRE